MPTAGSRTAGLYAEPVLPSCPWPQGLQPRVLCLAATAPSGGWLVS